MTALTQDIQQQALERKLDALRRLWKIANGGSGQCRIVAAFLLGLYNGPRFPFDMTDFRCLDQAIFRDCLDVLTLDYRPLVEVHQHLGVTSAAFEKLAKEWGIKGVRS